MNAPELAIEYVAVTDLKQSRHNARTHSKAQIRKIADSIKRFGVCTALGVGDDNELVYGHARHEAAKLLKMEKVPVIRLAHLSPEERRAVMLADNRLALDAGWDRELLAVELEELAALDFELPALGFNLAEIDDVLESAANSKPDRKDVAEDELPLSLTEAITRPGNIWHLERHRLLCGDARESQSYGVLLCGEEVGMIFTDPP